MEKIIVNDEKMLREHIMRELDQFGEIKEYCKLSSESDSDPFQIALRMIPTLDYAKQMWFGSRLFRLREVKSDYKMDRQQVQDMYNNQKAKLCPYIKAQSFTIYDITLDDSDKLKVVTKCEPKNTVKLMKKNLDNLDLFLWMTDPINHILQCIEFALTNGSAKKGSQLVNQMLLLLYESKLLPSSTHREYASRIYKSQMNLSHESMALLLIHFSLFSDTGLESHLNDFKQLHKTNKLQVEVQKLIGKRPKPQPVETSTNDIDNDETLLKDLSSSPERAATILAKNFNVGHIAEFESQINTLLKHSDPITFLLQCFDILFKMPTLNSGVAVVSYAMSLFQEQKVPVLPSHREAALKFCDGCQANIRAQLLAVMFFFFNLEEHLDKIKPASKREDVRKKIVKLREESEL